MKNSSKMNTDYPIGATMDDVTTTITLNGNIVVDNVRKEDGNVQLRLKCAPFDIPNEIREWIRDSFPTQSEMISEALHRASVMEVLASAIK